MSAEYSQRKEQCGVKRRDARRHQKSRKPVPVYPGRTRLHRYYQSTFIERKSTDARSELVV